MTSLSSYQDLIVWQKSLDLAEMVYRATEGFPRSELFGLASQMRRAAVSIPSNIAEGQSRNSTGEFVQFLGIARGSLAELETQRQLGARLGYLNPNQAETMGAMCTEISKMLTALRRSLRSSS